MNLLSQQALFTINFTFLQYIYNSVAEVNRNNYIVLYIKLLRKTSGIDLCTQKVKNAFYKKTKINKYENQH